MAPAQMRPEPLRTASGLGFGSSSPASTAPEHIAPAVPEQGADALRVARLQRFGVPRGLAELGVSGTGGRA